MIYAKRDKCTNVQVAFYIYKILPGSKFGEEKRTKRFGSYVPNEDIYISNTWEALRSSPALAMAMVPILVCFNSNRISSPKKRAWSPYKNLKVWFLQVSMSCHCISRQVSMSCHCMSCHCISRQVSMSCHCISRQVSMSYLAPSEE